MCVERAWQGLCVARAVDQKHVIWVGALYIYLEQLTYLAGMNVCLRLLDYWRIAKPLTHILVSYVCCVPI